MSKNVEQWSVRIEQTVARWDTSLRRFSVAAVLFDTFGAFDRDNMSMLAGALAFFALLSLFPLLLLLIALAPLFVSEADAIRAVMQIAGDYLPGSAGEVQRVLRQVVEAQGPASVIGVLTLLWSASGVFDVLQSALDRAWRVPRPRALWLQRLFSISVIGALGGIILVSLVISSNMVAWVYDFLGDTEEVRAGLKVLGTALAFVLAYVVFVLLYKTFPHARVGWREALWGSVLATLLGNAAKVAFDFYLVNFARFNLVYGSIGAVIGLLIWGYVSAMVVLLGAELAATLARRKNPV